MVWLQLYRSRKNKIEWMETQMTRPRLLQYFYTCYCTFQAKNRDDVVKNGVGTYTSTYLLSVPRYLEFLRG